MKLLYKALGQTPLECIEEYRQGAQIQKEIPMTYAGRLDPMAEGLLICLVGKECKEKENYTKLDKTYEFEILVGFSTDTYDLLGLVEVCKSQNIDSESLSSVLKNFVGLKSQKYPKFSSKTVDGKQLFQLSKDKNLPEELPSHMVTVTGIKLLGQRKISLHDLDKEIVRRIQKVNGDFRQKEILETWDKMLGSSSESEFQIFSLSCDCSSGTYIRQLASDIGENLEASCVTFSIKRTKVGDYSLADIDHKES